MSSTHIFVAAATSQLGVVTVNSLLADLKKGGIALSAGVRDPAKAPSEWAAAGVKIVKSDYEESADTWATYLQGVDRLLLISSGSGVGTGERVQQHRNVIEGAKKAGSVKLLAYTSIINADTATVLLAADHKVTEKDIKDSGIPYVFLRNGWYVENWLAASAAWKPTGSIFSASGKGKFSAATRADYAEAAAAVLRPSYTESNVALELGGEAITVDDVAAVATQATGTTIVHKSLPQEAYTNVLVEHAKLPAPFAAILADIDVKAEKENALYTDSDALQILVGKPLESYKDAITKALTA